jgi:hypothetical protein
MRRHNPWGAAVIERICRGQKKRRKPAVVALARYRLTVNGSTPSGVTDASGRLIDGAGTGQPGSDFVRSFGRKILAGPNRPTSSRAAQKSAASSQINGQALRPSWIQPPLTPLFLASN